MNRFMRVFGQWVLGLALVGFSGIPAQAAWEGSQNSGILSGKIASVDPQHNLVKVRTGLFTGYNFIVKETSKISNGVRDMRLEELKPGDKVSVSFDNADGKRVISSLRVNDDSERAPTGPPAGAQAEKMQPPAAAQPEPAKPPMESQPATVEPPAQSGSQAPAGETQ